MVAVAGAPCPAIQYEHSFVKVEHQMEPRISIVTLGVADLQRSIRFYEEGLGWKRSSSGGDEIAFFHTRGVALTLYPRHLLAADANLPDLRGWPLPWLHADTQRPQQGRGRCSTGTGRGRRRHAA